ncbi:hypothetical protein ACEQ8H_007079 [Pleosporales sp. CAS-2024a]
MPAKCKQREQILASGSVDVPALPLGAVRGILCFRCFDPTSKILKCGACKRAGYCSQECQKLDWKMTHKEQCKILRQINQEDLKDYKESRTWGEYRSCLIKYGHQIQKLTDVRDTVFTVQAQPYCSGCYRSLNQLGSKSMALIACSKCRLFHHCSQCPDSHTDAICANYQMQNKIEHFRNQLFEDAGKASVIVCTETPRSSFKSLAKCNGWYDYFVSISDKTFIKDCIEHDFSSITSSASKGGVERQEFEESRRMFLLLATDTLSMPLSIIAALENLALTTSPTLNIHLLGATGREFLAMSAFEEILHLVPSIRTLAITAVGPSSQLTGQNATGYAAPVALANCSACTAHARTRSLSAFSGLYHDFVASSPAYAPPHLIVAFNSGCVDGDDADSAWDTTIRLIVHGTVPALFTTYNAREAAHEGATMARLGARFVVAPQVNVWRSGVAMPEFLDGEGEMWRQNDWRYIIRGREGERDR